MEWDILPTHKNAKENNPALVLVNRPGHSAQLKGGLAVLEHIGTALYVEIFVNKARDTIMLVPKRRQTAYSRSVTSDLKTHIQIGGGQLLRDHFGLPFGHYKMTKKLVFKKS